MDGGGYKPEPPSPFQIELKIVRRTNTIVQNRTIQKLEINTNYHFDHGTNKISRSLHIEIDC